MKVIFSFWCLYSVELLTLVSVIHAKCQYSIRDTQINITCNQELRFPPGIPPNIYSIDLNNCKIRSLRRDDLARFGQLRIFTMAGNKLETVDVDAFQDNLKLQVLDISRNKNMKSNNINKLVCNLAKMNRELSELNLSAMIIDMSDFPQIVGCLEQMQLSALDLSASVKGRLKDYTFSKMTSLRVLKLGSIYPINLRALVNLTRLNTLRLSDTKLTEIPNFYDPETNETLLPCLSALYLDSNSISKLPDKSVGLENLEFISLRTNFLRNITSSDITTLSTKLKTLFLNTNKNIRIEECSFPVTILWLELRDCRIEFSRSVRKTFQNLTEATGLSLTKNFFDQSDDVLGIIFRGLANLTHLSLEECSLKRLPNTTFRGLHKLVMLTLNGNRISALNSKLFEDLHSLQTLKLARNQLTLIRKGVLDNLPRSLKEVDFSGNPFICTCDLLPFMKLFRSHSLVFSENTTKDAYRCHNPPKMQGKNLTSFILTDDDCVHLSFGIKMTITACSVAAFIAVVTFTVYRNRWYIGYVYFILRAKRREARENSDQTQYTYDAFVVYNKHDLAWVRDKLLPVLEGDAQLRLCLHDRDWLCGRDIVDNIVESIEGSRKTLLVISNAFAASQWCHLEMTLAQHRLLAKDRNALVLVLLEPIERRNVTPRLLLQMRQQTYIEWTEDPTGERMFWRKLLRSLQKPTGSIVKNPAKQIQLPRFSEEGSDALLAIADNEEAGIINGDVTQIN